MNKYVSNWFWVALLVYVVCIEARLPDHLFAFLVLGIIPGTTMVVPSWLILTLYPLLFLVTLTWLRFQTFFIGEPTPVAAQKKHSAPRKAIKTRATTKRSPTTKKRSRAAA